MITRFLIFGVTGWCMEILWTGVGSFLRRDFKLTSNTSIWMFFIYGMAVFLKPVCDLLISINIPAPLRGAAYMICIFAAEFAAGWVLGLFDLCPWDYSGSRFAVKGIIRLDYAPLWFAAGLLFEYINVNLTRI